MGEKVLFVDDEQNVLDAIKRQLRKKFNVDTALGPDQGLIAVNRNGPYAVVVSDLRMPGMDGIEFLSRVRKIAPHTVRVMLTGNADLESAIYAVNQGNVFQFLTKPCTEDALTNALNLGIKQYRLIIAERELLGKTLKGSIKILIDLLSLANPEAFGRSSRIKQRVLEIVSYMDIKDSWQIETATMLSHIGCIILPAQALKKLYRGQRLAGKEKELFDTHPTVGADLIARIPRMESIADIILYQSKDYDGSGNPRDSKKGEEIPLGARILKVVLDFDTLEAGGTPKKIALKQLKQRAGWYDPAVLNALEEILGVKTMPLYDVRMVTVKELISDMVLGQDVKTTDGLLLVTKGQEVNLALIQRLKTFTDTVGLEEPFRVYAPR
ncbi:MAG: HD domain-containing phosphohydrolase [Patescibacteria group bacterium]